MIESRILLLDIGRTTIPYLTEIHLHSKKKRFNSFFDLKAFLTNLHYRHITTVLKFFSNFSQYPKCEVFVVCQFKTSVDGKEIMMPNIVITSWINQWMKKSI